MGKIRAVYLFCGIFAGGFRIKMAQSAQNFEKKIKKP